MADDNSFSEYQELLDGLRMDILEINTFSRAQRLPPIWILVIPQPNPCIRIFIKKLL